MVKPKVSADNSLRSLGKAQAWILDERACDLPTWCACESREARHVNVFSLTNFNPDLMEKGKSTGPSMFMFI